MKCRLYVNGQLVGLLLSASFDLPSQWTLPTLWPANVRVLVSRNRREGAYLGRYRSVWDRAPDGCILRRHHRKGASSWPPLRRPGGRP